MKKITIFCDGGLGNRFGVLIGGLITADKLNAKPIICWPENSWCGCSFTDLFDVEIDVISDDINTLFEKNMDNVFMIHENQTKLTLPTVISHSESNIQTLVNDERDIIYYHNQVPSYYGISKVINKLTTLKIKQSILDEVNKFCSKNRIDKKSQGVHFRKTDANFGSIDDSIFQIILSNPTIKYYICSDDKDTEMKFKQLENVYIYPKSKYVEKLKDGGWNDLTTDFEGRKFTFNVNRPRQSVIEAFVDLLILSRTNIIVNGVSSFLNFAKLYSNIEL